MVAFQTESTVGVYDLETSSVTLLASFSQSITVFLAIHSPFTHHSIGLLFS